MIFIGIVSSALGKWVESCEILRCFDKDDLWFIWYAADVFMFIVLNPRLIVLWLTNLLPLELEHRIPNMKNFQLPDVSFFQECVPYQGVYDSNNKKMSGWWQLKYVLCSTRKLGKMKPPTRCSVIQISFLQFSSRFCFFCFRFWYFPLNPLEVWVHYGLEHLLWCVFFSFP